jgi:hypothetical protein
VAAPAQAAPHDPREIHRNRLEVRRAELRRDQQRDFKLSITRAAVVAFGFVAWAFSIGPGLHGLYGVAAAAVAFFALLIVHEQIIRARDRAARRVAFHEAALARLDDEWAGRGEAGSRYLDVAHPYAADLDLFGRGSLFERLCSARTRTGQDLLAAWLVAPATPAVVALRQAAQQELRPRLDLREDLAVLGGEARHAVDSASLRAWATAPAAPVPVALRGLAVLVSAAAVAALVRLLVGGSLELFVAALAIVSALAFAAQRWTAPILRAVGRPADALATLSELVGRLEAERFEAPLLLRLRGVFGEDDRRASRRIARLRGLMDLLESKRNPLFAPFAFLLLWDLHVAAAIEGWRRDAGATVAAALEALAEAEALCALAAYGFENPGDPFAVLVDDGPVFHAKGLVHPLLPQAQAVRNDVELDAACRLLVVTGSNMSGKSTLLRTIGINAVLAQAGAPVRARELRLSPLVVGASIRIQDSLQEGKSRFYAEITRVRQIMDLASGGPGLVFLLDEIFHGTNSADRRVGAEAVVRALVDRGAIGLVTSHDLAIAQIADDLAPRAANVHFEDHLEGDRIAFDYRMKAGPVRKSNALALMRAVGLDV